MSVSHSSTSSEVAKQEPVTLNRYQAAAIRKALFSAGEYPLAELLRDDADQPGGRMARTQKVHYTRGSKKTLCGLRTTKTTKDTRLKKNVSCVNCQRVLRAEENDKR